MRALLIATLAYGCGRIDFAERDGGAASAITASFGETGTATYGGVTRDTTLDQQNRSNNYGAWTELDVDATHGIAMIAFDLSAIPTTATVLSSSFRITTSPSDISPGTATLVRVLEAWDEGAVNGLPGAANYDERELGVPWSAPGAAPPSTDPLSLGTFQPSAPDTAYTIDLPASLVASWVADPASNLGMAMLLDSNDGATLRSREAPDLDRRPVLTVVYIP